VVDAQRERSYRDGLFLVSGAWRVRADAQLMVSAAVRQNALLAGNRLVTGLQRIVQPTAWAGGARQAVPTAETLWGVQWVTPTETAQGYLSKSVELLPGKRLEIRPFRCWADRCGDAS
jgi:hypothetical protein